MSRLNDIEDAIWSDPPFHALTPDAKLLYVWSFTNAHVGMAGLYKVPESTIAHETGLSTDQVTAAIGELEAGRFLFYDGTWMYVRARVKRLRTRTVMMCRAVAKQVATCPEDHPFRLMLLEQDGDRFWSAGEKRSTIREELEYLLNGVPGLASKGSSSYPSPMPSKGHKGKGYGKGNGRGHGVGVQGEGRQLVAWSRENLPDLPADVVSQVFVRQRSSGTEPTPESVRDEIAVRWPEYVEGRAA